MRILTLSVVATLMSVPAFAADLGTYRPGTPYHSSVSAGADVCDSQCAGDAQCRGWNYVKPNPDAPGICEYLSTVSSPISSQISISGESLSAASYSPLVTSGGTNTIRVGTQVSSSKPTIRVGKAPSSRRVIRQPIPQRSQAQGASTRPVDPTLDPMSLAAQQNRYRQGQMTGQQAPAPVRQATRQPIPAQRPMFRPLLDGPSAGVAPQQQIRQQRSQSGRRVTGPRNAPVPNPYAAQVPARTQYPAGPQNRAAIAPNPYAQNPALQNRAPQTQNMVGGSSRPPIGKPIMAPQPTARPQPSTPSQRLAQFTAQTQAAAQPITTQGPTALSPQQAQKSLFGSLNDDLLAPAPSISPGATAVPTTPVMEQELGAVLAGGR